MVDNSDMLVKLDARLARIETALGALSPQPHLRRELYTVTEAAEMFKKQPFTVREWCRLGRIHAEKRKCGRGRTTEWVISVAEIERYLNEGLLPLEL